MSSFGFGRWSGAARDDHHAADCSVHYSAGQSLAASPHSAFAPSTLLSVGFDKAASSQVQQIRQATLLGLGDAFECFANVLVQAHGNRLHFLRGSHVAVRSAGELIDQDSKGSLL